MVDDVDVAVDTFGVVVVDVAVETFDEAVTALAGVVAVVAVWLVPLEHHWAAPPHDAHCRADFAQKLPVAAWAVG